METYAHLHLPEYIVGLKNSEAVVAERMKKRT